MAYSPPSPPPSAARLGQDSILPCILPSAVAGPSIMVFDVVVPGEARFVVDELFGGPVVGGDDVAGRVRSQLHFAHVESPGTRIVGHVELSLPAGGMLDS